MGWSGRRIARILTAVVGVAAATAVRAAEGGISFWIPGQAVPQAGVLPPPGFFFDTTGYFYSGDLGGGRATRLGGNVVADVKLDINANFLTGLWVTPVEIFGGNLAFAAVLPWGDPGVRAGLLINGPIINRLLGRPLALGVRDEGLTVGDPILSTMLGWHHGKWHWKVGAAVSIPAGGYEPGQLSNLALNRYLGDLTAGVTYLDPELGIDLSAAGGFTFNGYNPATQYRTGTEFHADFSATKFLSKEWSVGAIVSHYEQITGDTGSGATIGPFQGRVTAVGGSLGYNFNVGQIPVLTKVKVLREVEVKNRFQGTIGFVEVSFPLWVAPPKATEAKPMSAKF